MGCKRANLFSTLEIRVELKLIASKKEICQYNSILKKMESLCIQKFRKREQNFLLYVMIFVSFFSFFFLPVIKATKVAIVAFAVSFWEFLND